MNLCRCANGHFYDKEKYATCPHCNGGSAVDDTLTAAFTEDANIQNMQNIQNIQNMQGQGFGQADDAGYGRQMPGTNVTEQVSQNDPFPIADMGAEQTTVSKDYDTGQKTEALDPWSVYESFPGDDNDHTIGIFEADFGTVSGQNSRVGTMEKKPAANKVSTPCVGWLIALGGEHVGTDFRLKAGKNFVGRSPQMDVALTEDKSVSRDRHAIVVYEPKAHLYLVQPGESSSLVYRNNEVVLTPVKLEAYDMITVGDVNLLFIPLCGERFNWSDLFEEMKKKG